MVLGIFGVFMRIHHKGYVVSNAQAPELIQEGMYLLATALDEIQGARICLYKNEQNELIELVQPLSVKSTVWNFLQKAGNGFHHFCYEASIEEIEKYTTENRLYKIMGPVPATIFSNRMVVFYMNLENKITEFII